MIYNNLLNTSFSNKKGFSAKGCQLVFFINSNDILTYSLNNNVITSLNVGTAKFNSFENLEEIKYSIKTELSKSGVLYAVELSFSITKLHALTSDVLGRLQNSKQAALILDNNGSYRLLGYEQGLTVSYEQASDDNAYTVTLTTKQKIEPQFIDASIVNGLAVNSGTIPTTIIEDIYVPPTNGGSNTVTTNVLNLITIPYNNYQLLNTNHIAVANNAYTILLPTSPVNGQEHTIKAGYDASVTPIIVRSTNALIDGYSEVRINTEYGALTVFYENNKWLVRNFTN